MGDLKDCKIQMIGLAFAPASAKDEMLAIVIESGRIEAASIARKPEEDRVFFVLQIPNLEAFPIGVADVSDDRVFFRRIEGDLVKLLQLREVA